MKSGPTLPVHQRDLKNVRQIKFESNGYSSSPWDLGERHLVTPIFVRGLQNIVLLISGESPESRQERGHRRLYRLAL